MEEQGLGPNGGLVYCMEYLEQNLDWLFEKLEALEGVRYFLFDFPGQVCACVCVCRSPSPSFSHHIHIHAHIHVFL